MKKYEQEMIKIKKAIDEAEDNEILKAYALGALCALYERQGDEKKIEQAYKLYAEAVSKMPPECGGMDLKRIFRDTYQGLLVLGKHSNSNEVSEALSKESILQSGLLPSNMNIKEVYKSFPVKYE